MPNPINIQVSTQRGLAPSPIDEYNFDSEIFNTIGTNIEPNTVALLPLLARNQSIIIRSSNPSGTTVYAPTGSNIAGAASVFVAFNASRTFSYNGVNFK